MFYIFPFSDSPTRDLPFELSFDDEDYSLPSILNADFSNEEFIDMNIATIEGKHNIDVRFLCVYSILRCYFDNRALIVCNKENRIEKSTQNNNFTFSLFSSLVLPHISQTFSYAD
jgi:hypothetical protein